MDPPPPQGLTASHQHKNLYSLPLSFSAKQTQAGLFLNRPSTGNHQIDFFVPPPAPTCLPSLHPFILVLFHCLTHALSLSLPLSNRLSRSSSPSLTSSPARSNRFNHLRGWQSGRGRIIGMKYMVFACKCLSVYKPVHPPQPAQQMYPGSCFPAYLNNIRPQML